MSVPVDIGGDRYQFCASTETRFLDSCLNDMINWQGNYYLFFSDDCTAKIDGEFYNIDISSCDQSNDLPIFDRLDWLVSRNPAAASIVKRCIKQCLLPIRLRNPNNSSEVISAKPRRPIESSGTILTTVLNNIASFGICLSLNQRHKKIGMLPAAAAVGYIITCKHCDKIEDIQFLKMSPSYSKITSSYHMWTNLGPLLRSLGNVWGDIPYRKTECTLDDAIRSRVKASVLGFKHSGLDNVTDVILDTPLCRVSKIRAIDLKTVEEQNRYKGYLMTSEERQQASIENIADRYSCDPSLVRDWLKCIRNVDIGWFIQHPFVDLVFNADYEAVPFSNLCPLDECSTAFVKLNKHNLSLPRA